VSPAPGSMAKRSVAIAGHRTSVSLEYAFWAELKALADAEGRTVNELVTRIDRERAGNLSSAIRVYVLTRVKERA
jgi:predicted DNA-binding ribbon-helix-helix protein